MQRLARFLRDRYFTFDARSLGVFRIVFGCVLLYTLSLRWTEIDYWYTNDGLVPNHTLLWRPSSRYVFSLFLAASDRLTANLLMTGCLVVFVSYTLGYRTRLFQILALVANVSLNSRILDLENGADMMANLLLAWTLFLPLGRRFSLDAALGRGASGRAEPNAVVSFAVLALLLQFSIAYAFNGLHKSGEEWRDGTAVHYVLHQDRVVTAFGVWLREHAPPALLAALTRVTVWIELIAPVLLLSPIDTRTARLTALVLYPLLHLGFRSCLNFGNFAITMTAFFALLPNAEDWAVLERLGERVARRFSTRVRGFGLARVRALFVLPDREPGAQSGPSPFFSDVHRLFGRAREATVLLLMAASLGEVLMVNPVIPSWARYPQPAFFQMLIEYPRLLQGWKMFAPNAPKGDAHLHVDAVTTDGRHVDPYNEVASRVAPAPLDEIPSHLENGKFFKTYSIRMPTKEVFRRPFEEWVLRYHERSGDPRDRIVRFDVYELRDKSPPPGQVTTTDFEKKLLFSHPRKP